MKRILYVLLALTTLAVSVPTPATAHPGEGGGHGHGHGHPGPNRPEMPPQVDWNAMPADIQALKTQLDQIRTEQKNLFLQMRAQHEQIKKARQTLTSAQRQKLKKSSKPLFEQLKSTRDSIRALREQKRGAWQSFGEHAEKKEWAAAKSDLEKILKQKKEIVGKQQGIVKLQQQLIAMIGPAQSHVHFDP